MENMFEFKRGNPDKLQGKASLYLEDHVSISGKPVIHFPAFYIAPNLEDLIFPGENIEIANLEEVKKFAARLKNKELSLFSRFFSVRNPSDLEQIPGDIIYLGQTRNAARVGEILFPGAVSYGNKYIAQQQREKVVEPIPEEVLRQGENDLTKQLYELSFRIMFANRNKDIEGELAARQALIEFAAGKPFQPQVREIINLMSSTRRDRYQIMDMQSRLATLVNEEKYEDAARLRKEIDKLMKTPQ